MTRAAKIIHNIIGISALLLLTVLSATCADNSRVAWSGFENMSTDGWNVLDGREFRPFDGDSIPSGVYQSAIVVRHTDEYKYTQLWLEMEQADSTGVIRTDTIRVDIADDKGRFRGNGRFGLYETIDTLTIPVRVTPGWQAAIRHLMKDDDLEGVNNVGLMLLRPANK